MLMAYTKTNWNENTPITADRLNNIETGVANSLDTTTGGLVNGKLTVNGVLRVNKHIDTPIVEANTDLIINKYDFKTYYTSNEFGSYIYCGKNKSSINLTDSKMTYANPNGNIEIGPQNSSHCHIYTDKPTFYFNKDLLVNGNRVYHAGSRPTAAEVGALPTSGGTLTGTLTMSKASGNTYYYAQRTDTGTTVRMGVGEGGINHGLYSDTLGKWMVYANATKVYLNGTASEWNGYTMRTGSGLSGTSGTITFTW